MNKVQILKKIKRNLDMLSIAATADATSVTVTATGMVISCVDADIAKPLGGIDGSVSPFLGIGVANPGCIKVKGGSGENTIAAIMTTDTDMIVLRQVMQFANDVIIEAGDTTAELARVPSDVDVRSLGQ